nr:hypothetical protein [uncultured Novosphingobium sp.]
MFNITQSNSASRESIRRMCSSAIMGVLVAAMPAQADAPVQGQALADATQVTGLPASGIVEATFLTQLAEGRSVKLRLPLSGLADRAVSFNVTDVKVARAGSNGGETLTDLAPSVANNCLPTAHSKTPMAISLGPNASCVVTFDLRDVAPGSYHLRTNLRAADGPPRPVDLPFKTRACWFLMLAWLALGAIGGGFVSYWRDFQRDRAVAALAVARVQDSLERLRVGTPDMQAPINTLAERLKGLRIEVADGAELTGIETRRAELAAKVALLDRIIRAWNTAVGFPDFGSVKNSRDAALQALEGGITQATNVVDGFTAAVAKFVDEKRATQILQESAQGAAVPIDLSWLGSPFGANDNAITVMRKQRRLDLMASVILALFFALIVLMTIWWPRPDWGDFYDQGAAVLIGAAAFGGMAATFGTFRTTIATAAGTRPG